MAIDDLWRQVAEARDDLAVRLVLADALLEAGDPRGELIQLQCAGAEALAGNTSATVIGGSDDRVNAAVAMHADAAERASELIAEHWESWLGELALVIDRRASRFHHGMLHTITVGMHETPPGAWERARGHRELCAVERVRARLVAPASYALFVDGLVHEPASIDIHTQGVVEALGARRARWNAREVRYVMRYWGSDEPSPLRRDIERLAELCPDVETLTFAVDSTRVAETLADVAPTLPAHFRRLRAVRLEDPQVLRWLNPEDAARIRALPFVELP